MTIEVQVSNAHPGAHTASPPCSSLARALPLAQLASTWEPESQSFRVGF